VICHAELSAYAIAMLRAQLQREKALVEIEGWRSKRSRMIITRGSTAGPPWPGRRPDMRSTAAALIGATALLLGACGEDASDDPSTGSTGSSDPGTSSPSPPERRTGTLTLSTGESVAYWCAGEGSPGVLLEAGTDSGGTDAYPAAFVDPLIAKTTVCTYDRPGTGLSDPAPRHRRTMRDLCAVQDEVVTKLSLPNPAFLVGQSGGGNLAIGCAARHPESIAGLVTIDSYHDDPQDLQAEGFTWTDNPEFVDYVDYSEELDKLKMPIGDFPVLIVSATQADPGGDKNQRYWLRLSPSSRQVVIEGPHDLHETAPEQVVTEILKDLPAG
jgi:pimeloyl-ACP methyl ester carboxylesterase